MKFAMILKSIALSLLLFVWRYAAWLLTPRADGKAG